VGASPTLATIMSFESRTRMSLDDAKKVIKKITNRIPHVIDNQDGTYSVMSHINCETCDYCDARNQGYKNGKRDEELDFMIHIAQEDPYRAQKKKFPENYGF
jgi:hypothetical protein